MIPAGTVRRVPDRPGPSPVHVIVPRVSPPARRSGAWMGMLAGFAAGGLIAGSLFGGFGHALGDGDVGLGLLDLLIAGGGIVVLLIVVRHRRAARAQPTCAVRISSRVDAPSDQTTPGDHPGGDSSFDRGVRDIRRTDPGFDPARFVGYAAMMFRDAQGAWMTRDIVSLRARVTPEMYGELQAQCDRLRATGHTNRVERIEITAEITEAWQDSDRDYVTASIGGSIIDYTVDQVNDSLVHGSRTIARNVEEFWTFTRPAGLNFWMLSAIQSGR